MSQSAGFCPVDPYQKHTIYLAFTADREKKQKTNKYKNVIKNDL